jgi:cytochrome P450
VNRAQPSNSIANIDSAEFMASPHGAYRTLRGSAASHVCLSEGKRVRGFFAYESVLQVLRDKNFVAEEYPCEAVLGTPASGNGYRDTQTHHRLRRLLGERAFLSEWRRRIAERADAVLQRRPERTALCLMEHFAQPLMLEVTAALLATDVPSIVHWGEAFASVADTGDGLALAQQAGLELADHVQRQFASAGSDAFAICSVLRQAGEGVNAHDAVKSLMVTLAAGHGTTSDMIVNAAVGLLESGTALAALHANVATVELAVEEALRFDPSVHQVYRTTLAACSVAGVDLDEGEPVLLALASANRDESVYADGGRFLPQRDGPRHLAFGLGPSYCIGAAFARMAIQEALLALARLAPAGRLSQQTWQWKPSAVLRGLQSARFEVGG